MVLNHSLLLFGMRRGRRSLKNLLAQRLNRRHIQQLSLPLYPPNIRSPFIFNSQKIRSLQLLRLNVRRNLQTKPHSEFSQTPSYLYRPVLYQLDQLLHFGRRYVRLNQRSDSLSKHFIQHIRNSRIVNSRGLDAVNQL